MPAGDVGVLLDRDGVVNEDRDDYVKSWSEFRFLPGALEGLRVLAALPCRVLLVTNQSAIGRGLICEDDLAAIHSHMLAEVTAAGGRIDRVYWCPHAPDAGCACRKPKPGMLLQARDDFGLDMSQSFFLGDRSRDLEAGRAAGARTIFTRSDPEEHPPPALIDHSAGSLLEAAQYIHDNWPTTVTERA